MKEFDKEIALIILKSIHVNSDKIIKEADKGIEVISLIN